MINKNGCKNKILSVVVICLILVISFFEVTPDVKNEVPKISGSQMNESEKIVSDSQGVESLHEESTESDLKSDSEPFEHNEGQIYDSEYSKICTLSVTCNSVLENMDLLAEGKREIIPKNGIIYYEENIEFYDNESVFDILNREMIENKIHFEFTKVPIYKSAYIEGIANLYEFDCGPYSGWEYMVNGIKPMYGCSQYIPEDGDKIEIYFTCNFMSE